MTAMIGGHVDPVQAAVPLLWRMTAARLLGRKTGWGFYDYQERR
jgi:3-hydroxyacyl-CoA dehydrogenase